MMMMMMNLRPTVELTASLRLVNCIGAENVFFGPSKVVHIVTGDGKKYSYIPNNSWCQEVCADLTVLRAG